MFLSAAVMAGSIICGCTIKISIGPTTTATTEPTTTGTTRLSRPAETTLTLLLEGSENKVAAVLFQSDLGYSMYYEKTLYSLSKAASRIDQSIMADRFTPLDQLADAPELFLEIGRLNETTPEQVLLNLQSMMVSEFATVERTGAIGVGVDKLDAVVLHGVNGTSLDSKEFTAAFFSDGKGGVYYYYIAYYVKVSEGIYARFNQYLDTFQVG
jgi:hypothetical protein